MLQRHRRVMLITLALIALLAGFAASRMAASAGPNIWTGVGPRTFVGLVTRDAVGNVYAIETSSLSVVSKSNPSNLLYKSSDGGQTWAGLGDYLAAVGGRYAGTELFDLDASSDGTVLTIIVSNRPGNTISRSIAKSTDGGATWRRLPDPDFFKPRYSGRPTLTIDPTDANRMYVSGRGGFYRSTDGGVTWQVMADADNASYSDSYLGNVAVDPGMPAHLATISGERGQVNLSDDYGATWRKSTSDVTLPRSGDYSPDDDSALVFVQRPGGQSYLLVSGALQGDSEQHVFLSKDGGDTWTSVLAARYPARVLGIDSSQGRMFVLFRTDSTGRVGQPTPTASPGGPYRLPPVQSVDTLYTSTDGEQWTELSRHPLRWSPGGVQSLQVSQKEAHNIFRDDGDFSTDGGQTWSGPSRGLPLSEVRVTRVSASANGWLAASNQWLYHSADKGLTWRVLYSGAHHSYEGITGMALDGDNVLIHLYPKEQGGGGGRYFLTSPTILRSTDRGATWSLPTIFTDGSYARFTLAPGGKVIYAAIGPTYYSAGGPQTRRDAEGNLYKSTDGGSTWSTLKAGMVVNNVLLDPADPTHLWAAGDDGLAESRDAGATWRSIKTSPQVGGLIYNDEGSSTTLYAYEVAGFSTEGVARGGPIRRGMHKSIDGGRTWVELPIPGAPTGYGIRTFAVGRAGHLVTLWLDKPGDYDAQGRISESLDGGSTWRELNVLGIGNRSFAGNDIVIDEETGTLVTPSCCTKLFSYQSVQEPADPAFQAVWQRQDDPVTKGLAQRSWTWGPQPFSTIREPLEGVAENSRIVQYYDKSRMEVNDPEADRNASWFVTNGLLTVEMVSGRVQTGVDRWEPRFAAYVPVAGAAGHYETPTYASFRDVATYEDRNNIAPDRTGQVVSAGINGEGVVSSRVPVTSAVKLAAYDDAGGHNIAAPFWEFLNRQGKVLESGQYVDRPIFGDWVFVMGRPITEPYWAHIFVGNRELWVLVQLFERRVLTYTPTNAPEWQVEMGNVGLHYYLWRYGTGF